MKLYKYVSENGLLRLLRTLTVRLSPPYAFNDPFELRPSLGTQAEWENVARDAGVRLLKLLGLDSNDKARPPALDIMVQREKIEHEEHVVGLRKFLEMGVGDNVGILCLSEDPANILMWGHYADSHRGAVIEFDSDHPFFAAANWSEGYLNILDKVRYETVRPGLEMEFFQRFPWPDMAYFGWYQLLLDHPSLFFTKSPLWSYEKEWRLVRQLSPVGEPNLDVVSRWADGYMSSDHPSRRIPDSQIVQMPATAIKKVILGASSRRQGFQDRNGLEEDVREVLHNSKGTSHVKIFRARIHESEYRVILFDLDDEDECAANMTMQEQIVRKAGFSGGRRSASNQEE